MSGLVMVAFLICLFSLIFYVIMFIDSLGQLLLIEGAEKDIEKLTLFSNAINTRILLMKDIRFYFLLFTGRYKKIVDSAEVIAALNISRRYLLIQYPLMIVTFSIPIVNKLYFS